MARGRQTSVERRRFLPPWRVDETKPCFFPLGVFCHAPPERAKRMKYALSSAFAHMCVWNTTADATKLKTRPGESSSDIALFVRHVCLEYHLNIPIIFSRF